jgi:hypothetical protein
MPELSRFYGIIIRMFTEPSERHHVPHFHAYYGEHVGRVFHFTGGPHHRLYPAAPTTAR